MNELKVRGPVRTLRKEHAEWDPQQGMWRAPRGVSTVTFRDDGQVARSEFHNPDGSIAWRAYEYGPDGWAVEELFWLDGGEPQRARVYSYGRDGAGRKTKVTVLPQGHAGTDISYGVEGTEHAYGAPGAVTLTVAYDDRKLPAEATFHDANGAVVRRIVLSRNDEGRLLNEVVYFGGESPFPEEPAPWKALFADGVFCSTTYAYDTRGRLLERTMRMGGLSDERATFQYHDSDDPIAETSSSRNHQASISDDGVVQMTAEEPRVQYDNRYEYQYDSRGNWTERVVLQRFGSGQEFQRSNVERRTITYYEL